MHDITVDTHLLTESPLVFFEKKIHQSHILRGLETEKNFKKVLATSTKFKIKLEDVISSLPCYDLLTGYPMLKNCKPIYIWSRNYFLKSQIVQKQLPIYFLWSSKQRNCHLSWHSYGANINYDICMININYGANTNYDICMINPFVDNVPLT